MRRCGREQASLMPTLGIVALHDPLRLAPQDEVFACVRVQGQRKCNVLQHHVHVKPQDPLCALPWDAVQSLHSPRYLKSAVSSPQQTESEGSTRSLNT